MFISPQVPLIHSHPAHVAPGRYFGRRLPSSSVSAAATKNAPLRERSVQVATPPFCWRLSPCRAFSLLYSVLELNAKLESRLEERKRASATIARISTDQVSCGLRAATCKADSSLMSRGLVSTPQRRDEHAQRRALSLPARVPRSRVTLGDLLRATHRLDDLRCPDSGLGRELSCSGERADQDGRAGEFIGERMYPR